jgi:hypothetical protein
VADLTPEQRRVRGRIERLIGAAAPVLDLVLATGDRVSRIVSRREDELFAVHRAAEPALLEPPGRTGASVRDGGDE